MTQRELARRSGLARQTILVLEQDRGYRPTGEVMVKLAEVLDLDLGSLFWTETAPEPAQAAV